MSTMNNRSRNITIWLGLGLLLFSLICVFSSTLIALYTDHLWFQSLDYTQIFNTRLVASLGLTAVAVAVAVAFLILNWSFLPYWIGPEVEELRPLANTGGTSVLNAIVTILRLFTPAARQGEPDTTIRPLRRLFSVAGLVIGVIIGLSFSGLWRTYLLSQNGIPFGLDDPIFGMDVSFYIFDLPWYQALLGRGKTLIVLTFLGVLIRYALTNQMRSSEAAAHISLLGATWLVLVGLGSWLERYTLLQSELGVVFGAGYTDVNARNVLYIIETVLFGAAAILLVVNAFTRRWKLLLLIGAFWLGLSLFSPIYPALVQRFRVEPNEFVVERPYIEHNINYTRRAYGLDEIEEDDYPATGTITTETLEENEDVLQNVRLWDYRPLLRTYIQLQEIRLYYHFNEVDIDRYVIDGNLRQVLLSIREMDVDQLAEQAQTWINRHIIFTHGYGLTMSPVSEVSQEGLPRLWVRDIPPLSEFSELEITRPQIYFGESTDEYALVNALEDEFDYPQGDTNAYTRYEGPDGIVLSNVLRRVLLAARFNSLQLLISPALTNESRILFNRTITQRAQTIAPMLFYDPDPYPVIYEGRIVWIIDAYTWTDSFPYSEPLNNLNYIRNSVKVTVDAYSGEINYYLINPEDPIAATYARIFPTLFKPVEEMPEGLIAHWRYPETLFQYQSQLYATYHMRDSQVFYNREDLWDVPQELVETQQRMMEPYYVLMRLPGSDRLEFMIMRPYVPAQKQNMIAWLYADSDGEDYGQLGVFKLPKERLIYGPQQVEGRAGQDAYISQQLTLWNQRGSQVIRGNLIVIPLEGTFLYIEPLYLEAQSSQLPELKRIIVAYQDQLAMAPTLDVALLQVLGAREDAPIEDEPPTIGPPGDEDMEALAGQAWERYQTAQACLAAGDWVCYGREQAALEEILRQMVGVEE